MGRVVRLQRFTNILVGFAYSLCRSIADRGPHDQAIMHGKSMLAVHMSSPRSGSAFPGIPASSHAVKIVEPDLGATELADVLSLIADYKMTMLDYDKRVVPLARTYAEMRETFRSHQRKKDAKASSVLDRNCTLAPERARVRLNAALINAASALLASHHPYRHLRGDHGRRPGVDVPPNGGGDGHERIGDVDAQPAWAGCLREAHVWCTRGDVPHHGHG